MNRIKRVSLLFKILFQVMFVALPILLIIAWATSPESLVMMGGIINMSFIPTSYSQGHHGGGILHTLSVSERSLGFCLSLIPTIIELYILYSLIRLFKLFELGEIFSLSHVRHLRQIGYALLIGQLFNPIYEGLMGIILTLHNPPGHRYAAVTLDQSNLGIIFIAFLVILISWIMAEGCQLSDEQRLTI